jgi:mannitol-1-phosphate 5-dehydrogenase
VIDDQVERVGRQPLRKLSRRERLISQAAYLAEQGISTPGLLSAVAAALRFNAVDDSEAQLLHEKLRALTPEQFVAEVCGLGVEHPLFAQLVDVVTEHQASLRIG